jgi:predicted signal transduction protein with EAL and GGDEF domain
VARLGGDEFVILLTNLSSITGDATAAVTRIITKIQHELSHPYQLDSMQHHSSPSIGVTLFSNASTDVIELLKQADSAMYQSKKSGRNTVRFYDQSTQAALEAHSEMEGALRRAIENRQLHLHYQIQVNDKGQMSGAEALLRWTHPVLGAVSPARFIPLAEETGLILSIGHWVLETACVQLRMWQNNPLTSKIVLAVNVSNRQFNEPGFAASVKALLNRIDVDPTRLKLEITESLLLDNVHNMITVMTELKALNVQFSMDDFGTGYSSLSNIKQLPLDQLKIDQSFIRDLEHDKNNRAIVRTIIAMATSMGIEIIAEGVETEAQRKLLINKGCINFQGYYFSRPLPLDEFEQLLRKYYSDNNGNI